MKKCVILLMPLLAGCRSAKLAETVEMHDSIHVVCNQTTLATLHGVEMHIDSLQGMPRVIRAQRMEVKAVKAVEATQTAVAAVAAEKPAPPSPPKLRIPVLLLTGVLALMALYAIRRR